MASITTPPVTGTRTGGTALPTALLVLVVLTLLGTAAVFTSSTELDIAGNGRQELRTLSVAEAGVHEAIARLNVRDPAVTSRIVPAEAGTPPAPVATWTQTIVNKSTLGAGEVQTLTGAAGTSTALQASTTIQYKIENRDEKPVRHCNGPNLSDCDNSDVVLFHTNFGYPAGNNVPTGTQVGPPVLQLRSTYSDGTTGAAKTIEVEVTRSVSNFKTDATLRTCGPIECTGSNTINATQRTDRVAIKAAGSTSGVPSQPSKDCAPHVPAGDVVQGGQACPATADDMFLQTWGMTQAEMKSIADIVRPAPFDQPPDGTKGKIIYVEGAAESHWRSSPALGTEADPLIVIFEGDFRISGSFSCYCIFYVGGTFTHGSGSAIINGAIISRGGATVDLSGSTQYIYNPNVVTNLNKFSPMTIINWKVN